LKQLVEVGRGEKLERLSGQILAENHAMRQICKKLGFKMVTDDDKRTCTAVYKY
jgi:acetyltransferase